MAKWLFFDRATYDIKPALLMDELLVAGLSATTTKVDSTPDEVRVFIEQDEDETLVNTVIASHDSSILTPAEQRVEDGITSLAGVKDRYANFLADDFLTNVAKVDAWGANLGNQIDQAASVEEIKTIVKGGFVDIANFLGPLLAYEIEQFKDSQ